MNILARTFLAVMSAAYFTGSDPAGAQAIVSIGSGFSAPSAVALDGQGNVFVADSRHSAVKKISTSGGYTTVTAIGPTNGFWPPTGAAVDTGRNIFFADGGNVYEALAAGGYTTINRLGSGFNSPQGIAIDAQDNVFVADTNSGAVKEILAAGGYTTVRAIGGAFSSPTAVAVDGSGNVFVGALGGGPDGTGTVTEILAAGGYTSVKTIASGLLAPVSIALNAGDDVFVVDADNGFPNSPGALKEIVAAGGYMTINTLASTTAGAAVAVDRSGNVFFASSGTTSGEVKEIPASGNYTTIIALGNGPNYPGTIALDGNDNVFVGTPYAQGLTEIPAAGGYTTTNNLLNNIGLSQPKTIAVDGSGNVFVVDAGNNAVREILAAGGYTTVTTIAAANGNFGQPSGIALDRTGNLFVADFGHFEVKEVLAAGGYTTVNQIGGNFLTPMESQWARPEGIAVDASGNVFVAIAPGGGYCRVVEILAAGGYTTVNQVTLDGGDFIFQQGIAVDSSGNIFVTDTVLDAVIESLASGGYTTDSMIANGFNFPTGIAVDGSGNVFIADSGNNAVKEIPASTSMLFASVLPGSRSVQVGSAATIFATMLNAGTTALDNCQVTLPASAPFGLTPYGLTLNYQTTDPNTNAPTGSPNTPVSIPGNDGYQTFLLSFQSTATLSASNLVLDFGCQGGGATPIAAITPGVDTVALSFSTRPTPDIIGIAAAPGGVLTIPQSTGGAGAFAAASVNAGSAGTITVTTEATSLPLNVSLCATNPATAACLSPPAASVTIPYQPNGTQTYSIFATASAPIAFSPGTSRVFLNFTDGTGALRGSTSVAVQTN